MRIALLTRKVLVPFYMLIVHFVTQIENQPLENNNDITFKVNAKQRYMWRGTGGGSPGEKGAGGVREVGEEGGKWEK